MAAFNGHITPCQAPGIQKYELRQAVAVVGGTCEITGEPIESLSRRSGNLETENINLWQRLRQR